MKKWVLLLGFGLTALYLAMHTLAPNLAAGFSNSLHDTLVRNSGKPTVSANIVMVDIDDPSLKTYGQWPWPRHRLATIINHIQADGASVIALDMIFPEADRLSPTAVQNDFKSSFGHRLDIDMLPEAWRNFDTILAESLGHDQTILSCYMRNSKAPNDPETLDAGYRGYYFLRGPNEGAQFLLRSNGLITSIPELNNAASNIAFFNTIPDADGVIRRTPLIWRLGENRLYPSISLEAVRMHLGLSQVAVNLDEHGVTGIQLGDRFVATDRHGRLVINYRDIQSEKGATARSFPHLSAQDILKGTVPSNIFRNRIVIIGTSAIGLHDLRYTPLSQSFAGAEIHANVIDNILAGDSLRDPIWMDAFEWVSILIMGLLITGIVASGRSWLAFLLVLLSLSLSIYLGQYFFKTQNLLFIPSHLILTTVLLYPVLTMFSYWHREQRERWLRKTFGPMVSDNVMRYIEEQKSGTHQLSQNVNASILFIDVQSFTKIAEQLGPEETSGLIKRFLSTVSEITMKHEGFVDKYIGDMMMAVWGVPYSMENHAEAACFAALEQIEALKQIGPELKALYGHSIEARIGINSGRVTAGNMGSEERFNYTVIGDSVNIAARFEPLNKVYQTRIILGEETLRLAGDQFVTRLLDRTPLTGRSSDIQLYELLGIKGQVPDSMICCAQYYEQALKHYWGGNSQDARHSIQEALSLKPDDGPSLRLLGILSKPLAD